MQRFMTSLSAAALLCFAGTSIRADVIVTGDIVQTIDFLNATDAATHGLSSGYYDFPNVPMNSSSDLANGITPTIVGQLAGTSSLSNLTNGAAQTLLGGNISQSTTGDQNQNTQFIIDLGSVREVAQFNTYAAHSLDRVNQVYNLYAATGSEASFNAAPAIDSNLAVQGWTLITHVDTTGTNGFGGYLHGGISGASIASTTGSLGSYRYFMIVSLDIGHENNRTNFGEADIIAIPEPATLMLMAGGVALMAHRKRA